jgi:hypothetical protein
MENTVNANIRYLTQHGRSIDAVIVSIQPGTLDGTAWPRLMTRSVIASAVANRCPVIAFVPERLVSVATGDGKLWWSTAITQDGSPAGDPDADGKRIDVPITVQAMIDPRVSHFNQIGELPATICGVMTLFIPLGFLITHRRPRRRAVAADPRRDS